MTNPVEFPSSNSRMSTPIVPLLCLGEVSGCTDSFSQLATDSDQSGKFNSSSVPESKSSMHPKTYSSKVNLSSIGGNFSEGQRQACGCTVKSSSDLKNRGKCLTFRETKGQSLKPAVQISGSDLAKLLSLILKEQDHVVPASPEEENSVQHTLKTLEKKISTLKSSVNLHTFVSLLDMLLDKLPSNECRCQYNHIVQTEASNMRPSPIQPSLDSSVVPEYSEIVSFHLFIFTSVLL